MIRLRIGESGMTVWQQKRCQSLASSLCMGVLLIFGRHLVKARAWTLTNRSPTSRGSFLLADNVPSTFRVFGRIATSLASTNGDGGGGSNPRTGWNHNVPDSWKSPNGEGKSKPSSGSNSTGKDDTKSDPTSKAARTGWLHNTKSRQEIEREQQQRDGSDTSSIPGFPNKAQLRLQQAMKEQQKNHRIVEPPTFHACGNGRQIVVTEHRMSVPIFRTTDDTSRIDIAFAVVEEVKTEASKKFFTSLQELAPSKRATRYIEYAGMSNADQMMVYLQGGPGFGAPTPVVGLGLSQDSSWAGKALGSYSRIVLMDQRGTGRSTRITKQSLEHRFPDLFRLDGSGKSWDDLDDIAESRPEDYQGFQKALAEATEYMAQFRADNIVKDAEEIREALMLPLEPGEVRSNLTRPWLS